VFDKQSEIDKLTLSKQGGTPMDIKTFGYIYYKNRGLDREQIIKEAEITADEYDFYETNLRVLLQEIEDERPRAQDIGAEFVRLTRYFYSGESDQEKGICHPPAVKTRTGEVLALPPVVDVLKPRMTLMEAIAHRRSLRKYAELPLSQDELSWLLWATQWVRDHRSNQKMEITLRNVPSAGARHPFETYILANNCEGIAKGLYYYHPINHELVCLTLGDEIASAVYEGCFRQEMLRSAPVTFIWTAIPYRAAWRYGQRGYRYLYLDAGHVGQNLHLAAEAIKGGACMIGAFLDEQMNTVISVDGEEEFVIYIATVGKK